MRRALVALLALPLAACGGERPVVHIPIPVPCVTEKPVRPDYPAYVARPGASAQDELFDRVKVLLSREKLKDGYIGELEAVVEACD